MGNWVVGSVTACDGESDVLRPGSRVGEISSAGLNLHFGTCRLIRFTEGTGRRNKLGP